MGYMNLYLNVDWYQQIEFTRANRQLHMLLRKLGGVRTDCHVFWIAFFLDKPVQILS